MLGGHHASLGWLFALAMFRVPCFRTMDGEYIDFGEVRQVLRDPGVFGTTAAVIFAVPYPFHCADWLLPSYFQLARERHIPISTMTWRKGPPSRPFMPLGKHAWTLQDGPVSPFSHSAREEIKMRRLTRSTALLTSLLLSACATPGSDSMTEGSASLTALRSGEWKVEDVGGQGVVDNSPATLLFGTDGNLSGNASCNRLIASYTVNGTKMTISPAGTTMMACPPALMDQERKLVDLLGRVASYSTDATGTLILRTKSGQQIVARR